MLASTALPLVYFTPYFRVQRDGADDDFALSFFVLVYLQSVLYAVCSHVMFDSLMAFHTRISDPAVGGTYMTLLNTATNLGQLAGSVCVCVCVLLRVWFMEHLHRCSQPLTHPAAAFG